jgi:hypothetical protein
MLVLKAKDINLARYIYLLGRPCLQTAELRISVTVKTIEKAIFGKGIM